MARQGLRVYGGTIYGTHRAIVAAYNMREAAKAVGISYRFMCDYFSIAGNKMEIEQAMKEPFTAFKRRLHKDEEWERVT